MSVETGRHILVWISHLKHYSFKNIWLAVDKIAEPPHPLRDVNPSKCSSLVESLRVHHFDYAFGMMTFTFGCALFLKEATLSEAFEQSDGRRVLKNPFKMVTIDGRNQHHALMTLCKENDVQWTRGLARLGPQNRLDGVLSRQRERKSLDKLQI